MRRMHACRTFVRRRHKGDFAASDLAFQKAGQPLLARRSALQMELLAAAAAAATTQVLRALMCIDVHM